MPFTKGQKKTGGRKKGCLNRVNKELRERIAELLDDNWDKFLVDLENLESKERLSVMLKLVQYILPRLSSIELDVESKIDELATMSRADRNERIRQLKLELSDDTRK